MALVAKDDALVRAHGLYLSAQASVTAATHPTLALLLAIEGAERFPAGRRKRVGAFESQSVEKFDAFCGK